VTAQKTEIVQAQAEMVKERADVDQIVAYVEALQVVDQKTADFAGQLVKDAKARFKQLDEREKTITKPLNEALKAARDLFRAPKDGYERIEKLLKLKVANWSAQQAAAQRQQYELAAQSYAQGNQAAASSALAQAATASAAALPAGMSVRYVWDYKITDAQAVPRELCSPDDTKIKAAISVTPAVQGAVPPTCPGLVFELRPIVTQRG
jgi:hypothetical protein